MTELKKQVEKALGDIRPALQADGGDIELIDVVDGTVKVRLQGPAPAARCLSSR